MAASYQSQISTFYLFVKSKALMAFLSPNITQIKIYKAQYSLYNISVSNVFKALSLKEQNLMTTI